MTNAIPQVAPILNQAEEKMKKSIERLRQDFTMVRTGRATGNILDHVKVEYYGSQVPLKQVAAVGVPDGKTIEVKPWDVSSLPAVEKAILASGLGLTPANDGKIIRINVPGLTEDRRKELCKAVRKTAEEFRVGVRNDRRDALEKIKKQEKDKILTEDQGKTAEHSLQGLTDSYVKKIDESLAAKETDIMEV